MPALVSRLPTSFRAMSSTVSILTLMLLTLTSLTSAAFVLDSVSARSAICPVMFPMSADNRIVNGDSGDPYVRSHLISFHREGCGGALLSKRWGITAGHCSVHEGSSPTIGGSSSSNGVQLPIKKVHTHPDFLMPQNDIVLIEFAEDAPDDTKFMYINDADAIPEVGEYARVAGWGHTSEFDNPNTANLLYQIDLPVVSTESCAKILGNLSLELNGQVNHKMHICAGYDRGECDSCKADSGGPLFLYGEDGELIIVALVSFGVGCAREGVPGGYVRTSSYVDWMKSIGAVFETRSSRKPVFLSDVSGGSPPVDSGTPSEPEAPPSPAPAAPSGEVPPSTSPVPPSSGSEQPDGTTAPAANSPPSGEGTGSNPEPQPPASGSGTAPPATPVGPASPPTADTEGSDAVGDVNGSPDTSSPASQGPPAGRPPVPVSAAVGGETGPEATIEGDPSASAGPEVSGNSGASFASSSDGGDGGVNVGVVVGSCVGVLAIVAAICVVVVLRRRAAARSRAAGTTNSSDATTTDATVTDAAADVAADV